MKSFEFEFLKTGYENKGRYVGKVQSAVSPSNYVPDQGMLFYEYTHGVTSPQTVLNSNVKMTMSNVLLQFNEGNTSPQKIVTDGVCMSGFGFNCKNHEIPERSTVFIKF
jgi:hypothetical protein